MFIEIWATFDSSQPIYGRNAVGHFAPTELRSIRATVIYKHCAAPRLDLDDIVGLVSGQGGGQ